MHECQRATLVMFGVPEDKVDFVMEVLREMTRRAVIRALAHERRHNKLDRLLIEAGAKNVKAVKALLDMSILKVDRYSGKIHGLDYQLRQLKLSKDSWFLFNISKEELIELKNEEKSFNKFMSGIFDKRW